MCFLAIEKLNEYKKKSSSNSLYSDYYKKKYQICLEICENSFESSQPVFEQLVPVIKAFNIPINVFCSTGKKMFCKALEKCGMERWTDKKISEMLLKYKKLSPDKVLVGLKK